jgi:CRISPR-associated protein Csh2
MTEKTYLSHRHEILFLYDIRMGNPNGDPSENRPRILPDGQFYVTDVRLKRFVRDFLKNKGYNILVDTVGGKTKTLTERILAYLKEEGKETADGSELFALLVGSFIDARLFGSALALTGKQSEPKSLTGAVQFNHGEVLHAAEELSLSGTSILSSQAGNTQGTFTDYYGLRYGLIGFHGIANEYNAERSRMTEQDYNLLLEAMWKGVRSAANTRTKMGQIPQLLLSIRYKKGSEFQMGGLLHYIRLLDSSQKGEKSWSSSQDYTVDLSILFSRINHFSSKIDQIYYQISPDLQLSQALPNQWLDLDLEGLKKTS